MRKIIVFCATLFVALSNSFAISGFTKGDEIPIPLESHVDEVDTTIFRGPVIPIYAAFDPVQSIIIVSFYNNIGTVSIELSNLLTGESSYYEEDTSSGGAILPFSGVMGYYLIQFMTEDGKSYYGFFSI